MSVYIFNRPSRILHGCRAKTSGRNDLTVGAERPSITRGRNDRTWGGRGADRPGTELPVPITVADPGFPKGGRTMASAWSASLNGGLEAFCTFLLKKVAKS